VNISQPKMRSEKFDDDNNNNNSCVKDVKYFSYRQHNEIPPPPKKIPKVTNPFHLKFSCFHQDRWSVGGLLLGLNAMW